MLGYIYVADTPHFGKTDADGGLRIESLPAGNYRVSCGIRGQARKGRI
jgi:hypothetical protein